MVDSLTAADPSRRRAVAADVRGGLAAAVIALPQAMPLGMLAFAPLGPSHAAAGALSGLLASIVGGITAALAGGVPIQSVGPRASAALVFASVLGGLQVVLPQAPPATLITLTFLSMLLGGGLQAGMALLHLGRLIRFVPRPVVAGFLNGLALAVLLSQIRPLLGLERDADLLQAQPASLLVGLTALGLTRIWPRRITLISPLLGGLMAGSLLYHLLLSLMGPVALGPTIGIVPAALPGPDRLVAMLGLSLDDVLPALTTVLAGAAVLALVASVDSLMSATAVDQRLGYRADPDRELRAHGLATMAAAACGGVPVTGSLIRSMAAVEAGGRTRLTPIAHSLILLAALLLAAPMLATLPLSAFAGIMIAIGLAARDDWSLRMVGKLLRGRLRNREVGLTVGIVVLVAGTLLATDVMIAVGMGVLVSGLLFVSRMSKPVLRRVCDARGRRSLRERAAAARDRLDAHADRLAVVELEGPLFFGTAEAMALTVESLAPPARLVVLDLSRVTVLDVTGGQVIARLADRLAPHGAVLLLGGIGPTSEHSLLLREIGVDAAIPRDHWFAETDAALEYAEDRLLDSATALGQAVTLADTTLTAGCGAAGIAILEALMDTRRVAAGSVVFLEGDTDQSLMLLLSGRITVRLRLPGQRVKRLAIYDPGVFFGEMALLQKLPRSADALADSDATLRVLTPAAFEALCRDHPALALTLMRNMAVETAKRLRVTTELLRAAYA